MCICTYGRDGFYGFIHAETGWRALSKSKVIVFSLHLVHVPSSESQSKNIDGDGLNDIRRSRDETEDEKEDVEEEVLSVQPESPCATNTTSTDPSRKQMFPVSSQ